MAEVGWTYHNPDGSPVIRDGEALPTLTESRGVFIPRLAAVSVAVVDRMRASAPGSPLGTAAYAAADAIGAAVSVARSFPIDPRGL